MTHHYYTSDTPLSPVASQITSHQRLVTFTPWPATYHFHTSDTPLSHRGQQHTTSHQTHHFHTSVIPLSHQRHIIFTPARHHFHTRDTLWPSRHHIHASETSFSHRRDITLLPARHNLFYTGDRPPSYRYNSVLSSRPLRTTALSARAE